MIAQDVRFFTLDNLLGFPNNWHVLTNFDLANRFLILITNYLLFKLFLYFFDDFVKF